MDNPARVIKRRKQPKQKVAKILTLDRMKIIFSEKDKEWVKTGNGLKDLLDKLLSETN
jgi:hypothetical protein